MKKICITLSLLFTLSCSYCSAGSLHDIQDKIGVDKFAHFGAGYIISDQLQRNCGMSALESVLLTTLIAYAKERLIDSKTDTGDISATTAGALFYQIKWK